MFKRKNSRRLSISLSLFLICLSSLSHQSKGQDSGEFFAPVSLSTGVEEAYFRGEKISYDSKKQVFQIEGVAVLEIPRDDLEVSADLIKIYKEEQRAEAIGNVIISGNEQISFSDYTVLDFSDQEQKTGQLENIKTQTSFSLVKADRAVIEENKTIRSIQYLGNGQAKSSQVIRISSPNARSLTIREHGQITDQEARESEQSYYIQAKEIDFYNDRIQNNLIVKGAKLKFKNAPLTIPLPFYPLTVGGSSQQMFSLVAGSNPNTGAGDFNLGPKLSFVLGDPSKRRALHISPFTQFGDKPGYGGLLGYTDPQTDALVAYGSSKDRFLVEFDRELIPNYLNFQYAMNSYTPESGIVKHFAELYKERTLTVPLIGGILNNEEFRIRLGAAYARDSQELRDEENNRISDLQSDEVEAVEDEEAGRFELELSGRTKPIFEYQRGNSLFSFDIGTNLTARQYTTGDFNGFFIISPTLRSKFSRYLDLEVSYNQLEATGESPFGFDTVLLGSSSITARGDLNLTKNFGLTAFSTYSITNQEYLDQSFGVVFGPENLKIALGFDPFRQNVNVEISTFFNDIFKFDRTRFSERKNLRKKKRFSRWF